MTGEPLKQMQLTVGRQAVATVIEARPALAQRVETTKDTLIVDLTDG